MAVLVGVYMPPKAPVEVVVVGAVLLDILVMVVLVPQVELLLVTKMNRVVAALVELLAVVMAAAAVMKAAVEMALSMVLGVLVVEVGVAEEVYT
jgi:hypothetical protein